MVFSTLIGPAVVAAVVSGVVTVVGITLNRGTSLRLQQERVKVDLELAERRAQADFKLATTKFELELKLSDWKRRSEFSEELLADFYKARDIFRSARSPFSFSGEGSTRSGRDDEPANLQLRKDAIFAPFERLSKERDFFSELHAKRFRAEASLGQDSVEPFMEFLRANNSMAFATQYLLEQFGQDDPDPEYSKEMRREIGWTGEKDDPIKPKLDAAVAAIEAICRPIIEGKPMMPTGEATLQQRVSVP